MSAGCLNCYAETLDRRFRYHQEGQPYRPWTHPNAPYNVRVFQERLNDPLRWRKPRMIFVNSRSDFFHEAVPTYFREWMWNVMKKADRHVFQILTKRPENVASMLPPDWGPNGYPNVWLGVSGETIDTIEERRHRLFQVPAAVRFLSAEPWLGTNVRSELCPNGDTVDFYIGLLGAFSWIIVGGESGPHARPMDLETVRMMRDACVSMRVPFFLKQLGGHPDARSHEKAVLDGRTWTEMPL